MEKKIAILRGINVGGKRKILMNDLKALCEKLSFENPLTYIQSGNVIFEDSKNQSNRELGDKLAKGILEKFGFEVPVIVRTAKELSNSIAQNSFYEEGRDISQLHLTFLKEEPAKENQEILLSYNYEPDEFVLQGQDVFIYCEGKYHKSKLSNNFFEKKLKVGATTRNWKTVLKLKELSQS
ncbi:MAG: DUF1697 domain-containing protein [Bacteroidia bacterium]|nr:DUF1697 domain-containing protein [Bacteroidia bacterium]